MFSDVLHLLCWTSCSVIVIASPQLNLPNLSGLNNISPDVSLNSYTPNRFNERNLEDNRSQRYGPPYADDDDHGYRANEKENSFDDQFRNTYDDRNRNPYNSSYGIQYPDINYQNPVSQYNDDQLRYQSQRYREELMRTRNFLTETDHKGSLECTANVAAQWNFETNVNDITQAEALLNQQRYSEFQHIVWETLKTINKDEIFDLNTRRQLQLLSTIGPSVLPSDQLDRYNRLINDMLAIYNAASICAFEQPFKCGLRLQPDLKTIMAKSRDWNELQYVWTEWRRKAGKPMRDLFGQLIDLMNDIALRNNYTVVEDYWFSGYETLNFREEAERVWAQIQPLYELLHSYVRRKLREFYGPDKISRDAPIPAHILGNMYGQSWTNILDIIIPYPGRNFLDVTPQMFEQGYTPSVMYQLAEEFFLSMNMSAMPHEFWANSLLEEPFDRVVLCQPSAWDFCTRHDFRIKMCTQVTQKDLIGVHHEMSHIQYFLHYRHQPKVYRDGANPGFHEAIGDAIGLSVSTPKHLQTLGLIQKSVDDSTYDINYLFAMAVEKVAFLPFALTMDFWRTDIFSKKLGRDQYNCQYWLLREQYGGIKPPVLRSEMDFDPGAKYHIPANIPYIKYFVGNVLQFQIYRGLCRAARQYDPNDPSKPLHKCDIYRQPEAGNVLKKLMEKGSSQQWQQTLFETIGESQLDGTALRDYFRPLEDWLRNENLRNQEYVGWIYDGDYCKYSLETAGLQVFGGFYNNASLNWSSILLCPIIILFIFTQYV